MATPPTPPTPPTLPKAPEQPLDTIVIYDSYDVAHDSTEELKSKLNTLLKWLGSPTVKNDPNKKAEYERNVKTIQTELDKREKDTTKVSPEMLKGVTTGVTNASNAVKEILNGRE